MSIYGNTGGGPLSGWNSPIENNPEVIATRRRNLQNSYNAAVAAWLQNQWYDPITGTMVSGTRPDIANYSDGDWTPVTAPTPAPVPHPSPPGRLGIASVGQSSTQTTVSGTPPVVTTTRQAVTPAAGVMPRTWMPLRARGNVKVGRGKGRNI